MENKKKNYFKLIPILVLLILGIFGGTYAFYYSEIAQSIGLNTSGYSVGIMKNGDNWGPYEVSFFNDGTSPVLLRISYNEIWSNSEGTVYNNFVNDETVVEKTWTNDFTQDFVLHDGWYYYKKTLTSKTKLQVLSAIQLKEYNPSWDYDYRTLDYELAWNYESVQATSSAASNVWGVSANIAESGNVTWGF